MKVMKQKLRAHYYAPDINMTGVHFTNELDGHLRNIKKDGKVRSEGVRLIVDYKPYNSKSKFNFIIKSKRKIYWLDKIIKIIKQVSKKKG
tara:strand:+ start:144 stop:413 length:270 start_codon:yes stop_codon:yes gene_type:complete